MRLTSFLYGAVFGAYAYRIMSNKRGNSLNKMIKKDLGNLAETAKSSVINLSQSYSRGDSPSGGRPSRGESGYFTVSGNARHGQASSNSKDSSLSQIKDFIKNNPEVKAEVEQILKETHTVIPGL